MEKFIKHSSVETDNQAGKIQELTDKFGKIYKKYGVAMWDDLADFTDILRLKYPDAQDYRFFHIISMLSGGPAVEMLPKLDFPSNDSVEKFIDNLSEKYPV